MQNKYFYPLGNRKILFFIVVVLLFGINCILAVYFLHTNNENDFTTTASISSVENTTEEPVIEPPILSVTDEENLQKEPCLVYNSDENKIEYANRMNEKCAPASLTKLLTALVSLSYVKEDTVFTVGTELQLVHENSSLCLIGEGQRLSVKDLLHGMLLVSGNDAAYTLAVNVAKSIRHELTTEEACLSFFTECMNQYAESIGMKNSCFLTPDGWDCEGQYTTAFDLLLLGKEAMCNDTIREIVKKESYWTVFESGENITWYNTNELLQPESPFYQEFCVGIKTGTTPKAGNHLISAFEGQKNYMIIVLGCTNTEKRYEYTIALQNRYCQ